MYMLQLRHHFGTEILSIHSVKILQPDKSEIKTGTVNFYRLRTMYCTTSNNPFYVLHTINFFLWLLTIQVLNPVKNLGPTVSTHIPVLKRGRERNAADTIARKILSSRSLRWPSKVYWFVKMTGAKSMRKHF